MPLITDLFSLANKGINITMKEKLFNYIDSIKQDVVSMSDYIFDNPELGLKEYKSSKILCDYLEKNGFEVELGIADLETAFRATYKVGSGGPSIGLLCEYDALENLGHACGHHMQGPTILATAIALKEVLKSLNFNIVVYGTPAEETTSGKVQMLNKGCFKDIDVALMMHGAPDTCVDVKSLAMSKLEIRFHGTSSHAALAPEKGRSSFDACLLFFQGIEFLREHVKEDTRIHYTILNAGGPANVVPKLSTLSMYVRSYNKDYLDTVTQRVKNIANGAAIMTETTEEIIEIKSLSSKVPVLSLNDVVMDNAELVKAPNIKPPREKTGSTDFGNLMYMVPGSCIRMAFVKEGTSSHSEGFLENGKAKEAHSAIIYAAKILAGTTYDIVSDEDIFNKIKNEFNKNKEYLRQEK